MPSRKRVAPTIAAVAILAAAGVVVSQATGEEQITGSDAARIGIAALEATDGGQVISIERSDDLGEAWEVEVRRGSREIDVTLDGALDPVGSETQARDGAEDDEGAGPTDLEDVLEPGGRERRSVVAAALRHAGGGVVESVERSDDPGETYEVEIVRQGRDIDVALDQDLRPVPNVRYDDDD